MASALPPPAVKLCRPSGPWLWCGNRVLVRGRLCPATPRNPARAADSSCGSPMMSGASLWHAPPAGPGSIRISSSGPGAGLHDGDPQQPCFRCPASGLNVSAVGFFPEVASAVCPNPGVRIAIGPHPARRLLIRSHSRAVPVTAVAGNGSADTAVVSGIGCAYRSLSTLATGPCEGGSWRAGPGAAIRDVASPAGGSTRPAARGPRDFFRQAVADQTPAVVPCAGYGPAWRRFPGSAAEAARDCQEAGWPVRTRPGAGPR